MKTVSLIMLLMIAPALFAQEIQIPEESMRNAWDESRQQFESLSSDYDSPLGDRYGYEDSENYGRQETGESTTDSMLDKEEEPALSREKSLDMEGQELR